MLEFRIAFIFRPFSFPLLHNYVIRKMKEQLIQKHIDKLEKNIIPTNDFVYLLQIIYQKFFLFTKISSFSIKALYYFAN